MKSFDKLIVFFVVIMIVLTASVDHILIIDRGETSGYYLVEVNRVKHRLDAGEEVSADDYTAITGICEIDADDESAFESKSEYVICKAGGRFYRIEYDDRKDSGSSKVFAAVNIAFGAVTVTVLAVLLYLRSKMIKPFNRISELPYELSKGNLTDPLKEDKSRYFGKFVWGLDMLREKLESSKQKEYEHAKAEKTMILSLSHDIKTPLSSIKLYSKALARGLYTDPKKLDEVYGSIGEKADEIERYLEEIIKHSSDDFLSFEVENREYYLSQVIDGIGAFYNSKLSLNGTEFTIEDYSDCIIYGDPDRLTEVLQNIIENAIKYGDGREITVSFSDEEDCRLVTVKNSGCELPKNELDHIFDSFWRGSNTNGKQGSGLGLYICRRLMNSMHGDIFADVSDGYMSVTAVCRKS
ncbi:MAG: HAMP domain-containing histidine kinase [Ruminococcus sp.]|uniref:sensor histidine kinase n=1 Tax=Ruminococcus sp. TaxID=41978 RepID=UPI0025CF289C|nr:HAMP domain-containing sensor histidine kinase [Ruminococcus sp.]MCR5541699.1 HAMP domain-containing histidine kinase [Ruminococcus sp.]